MPSTRRLAGLSYETAGEPVRIHRNHPRYPGGDYRTRPMGNASVCVSFGNGNVLALSPYLVQIIEPSRIGSSRSQATEDLR